MDLPEDGRVFENASSLLINRDFAQNPSWRRTHGANLC